MWFPLEETHPAQSQACDRVMISQCGPGLVLLSPQPGSKPEEGSPNGSAQQTCNLIISIRLVGRSWDSNSTPPHQHKVISLLCEKDPSLSLIYFSLSCCGNSLKEAVGMRGMLQGVTASHTHRRLGEAPVVH